MPTATAMMSTDEVSANDKVAYWKSWVWKVFGGLACDVYGDTVFDGRISTTRAGEVVLTRLESGRHHVTRSKSLVRASEQGFLKIVAPQRGCAGVEQLGRQAWVGPGQWSLYDTTETYAVANPEPVEHLIVMLPKADLVERGLPLHELVARPMGGQHGIARLALQTMRSAYQELPDMSDEAARGVGAAITQLVHLSLLDLAGRSTGLTRTQALRDRIKQLVQQRLGDADFGVDEMATALNCSRRQLYNAFTEEPEGVAGYLLRERLEAVKRDLLDPMQAGRSITDVAMGRGFNSLPHFSRVFAQRFGTPPGAYRKAQSASAA